MPSVTKIAVVGCGWVSQHRHLPVLRASPLFDIVGVIDRKPGRAEAVAKKLGLRRFAQAGALKDVSWIGEVDALTVATAPMAHYRLVKEALELGKHVLTEKPFTMSVPEGEDLVATAKKLNKQLANVHNFQFARSTKRLLVDIASGALGAVRGIDAVQYGNPARRLPEWYEDLPLGLFYDESPHLLYLMRAVAGPLRLSQAMSVKSLRGLTTPARLDACSNPEKIIQFTSAAISKARSANGICWCSGKNGSELSTSSATFIFRCRMTAPTPRNRSSRPASWRRFSIGCNMSPAACPTSRANCFTAMMRSSRVSLRPLAVTSRRLSQ